jgi:hypothetical protein
MVLSVLKSEFSRRVAKVAGFDNILPRIEKQDIKKPKHTKNMLRLYIVFEVLFLVPRASRLSLSLSLSLSLYNNRAKPSANPVYLQII